MYSIGQLIIKCFHVSLMLEKMEKTIMSDAGQRLLVTLEEIKNVWNRNKDDNNRS